LKFQVDLPSVYYVVHGWEYRNTCVQVTLSFWTRKKSQLTISLAITIHKEKKEYRL